MTIIRITSWCWRWDVGLTSSVNSPKTFPSSRRNLPPFCPSTAAGACVNAWTICKPTNQAFDQHNVSWIKWPDWLLTDNVTVFGLYCLHGAQTFCPRSVQRFLLVTFEGTAFFESLTRGQSTQTSHLLVEKDPEKICRWSEELFLHAEFTGWDLDAGVDRSSCAARGGNLFHTTRTKVWWELQHNQSPDGSDFCNSEYFRLLVWTWKTWNKPEFYPAWLWTATWTEASPHHWL